jgi:folate-dependent phosphoribosylglycinamide formyltransferase PurN
MRLGFICSSGGAALFSAISLFKACGRIIEPVIITDRCCGAYSMALEQGYEAAQIRFEDKAQFSSECAEYFRAKGTSDVLLFFTRLVGVPLIEDLRVFNTHPSLLPAFKGIGAVSMAKEGGALLLGASLHRVDEEMDSGSLKYQVATANLPTMSIERANKLSYLQKVWLTLNWFEECQGMVELGPALYPSLAAVSLATRSLSPTALESFVALEEREIRSIGGEN